MPLPSRLLSALAPWRQAPAWRVGFSGGLDSSVLLHLLAQLARTESLPPLSAIHVHHGLQAAADAWPAHCEAFCRELGVPLLVERVTVPTGASLEQAARRARYEAFAKHLKTDDCLLAAQHRDDQAETLLFRLLRGAGVRGLAGIPAARPLGAGMLLRPLLDVPRAELESYAREHGLRWIEDPSNTDTAFARNYLRQRVLPLLAERWPRAVDNIARSAAHLAEAEALLAELAQQDLAAARPGNDFDWLHVPSLALAPLLALGESRQRNALRHWLAPFTPMPDSAHWAGWQALRDAAGDAAPVWRLGGGELQRSGGRLWWLSGAWLQAPACELPWDDPSQPLALPGNGLLHLEGAPPVGPLRVTCRRGGEQLELARRGHRDLKRLLNESAVPAFVRPRLPLLWRGGQLLGVANLPALRQAGETGWRLRWTAPTNDPGLS
ncbi:MULTISPECIES: tRNA lysidine(34) synthetase TilS [unclassified Pseudomonas]|uniref:tRNA lysidine(34) synthetase TilS n=1 Tax=unclassified Pseudomonas TaxID=196821 RepID=UPI000730E2A8|nr:MULTISPECIES: tRNA lysidine(34) synthetase TilS [unclassified Pseudomonas]KSW23342.1 tRNA(Ile)-lysidine synthetase [Pseudomonas sp. ADP]OBP11949.1 tRNA lysidine(34) synthetase TilS [Pseudomonas sp. EGD-AKN5]QOF86284.1 tRNA lysidine(34) synthetase TilS [Pseudomonas sp. ADPe]